MKKYQKNTKRIPKRNKLLESVRTNIFTHKVEPNKKKINIRRKPEIEGE